MILDYRPDRKVVKMEFIEADDWGAELISYLDIYLIVN